MSAMSTAGLSLDQGPPLSIPAAFFVLGPLAMLAAGVLLVVDGEALTVSRQLPATVAAVHLGTLGLLASVMFGALYQMIPVVAGTPVPGVRAAHGVLVGLGVSVISLVWAFASGSSAAYWVALQALVLTSLVFMVPVAVALWRAPSADDTVRGMRVALLGLFGVVALGITLAAGRAAGLFRGDTDAWLAAHVTLGLVAWVGGLLTAVSWQIVPMFYLTEPLPRWSRRLTRWAVSGSALAAPAAAIAGTSRGWVLASALPGALAVWVLHPIVVVRALRRRRRKRVDESLRFWLAGMAVAPWVLGAALLGWLSDDLGWSLVFGWLAIWGWAGLVVHGMLTRIVPFLVWFHRFSSLVGLVKVPAMRKLWPARRARLGLLLHLGAVLAGAAAPLTGGEVLPRVAGALLIATALVLLGSLIAVLRRRPDRGEIARARQALAAPLGTRAT